MASSPDTMTSASLIAGGCPQFLDYTLSYTALADLPSAVRARFTRQFCETVRPGSPAGPAQPSTRTLHCLYEQDGRELDMLTNAPCGPSTARYTLNAVKCLADWLELWIPLPFLHMDDKYWPDGAPRFKRGPANWARGRFSREGDTLRLTLAFDMQVEAPPADPADAFAAQASGQTEAQGTGQTTGQPTGLITGAASTSIYFALSPEEVNGHKTFRLAAHPRDNAWFTSAEWVDDWLFADFEKRRKRGQEENVLQHRASYLTLLELVNHITGNVEVKLINPTGTTCVDVDLVLDIGNSRTSAILVETQPQTNTRLSDSYPLQLRDLGRPGVIYTEPFETRVEFAETSFGNARLSLKSGRRTPAFMWPSSVRVGPEAARLSTLAVCAEGPTGLSSPKRYLWDERKWEQGWRCNMLGGQEPWATHGLLGKRVNFMGTPLMCMDDALFTKSPGLRKQDDGNQSDGRQPAYYANFTRSSLMMFMLVEIFLQALTTINSPGKRAMRDQMQRPRRLRQIIFTVPPGMPLAEQRIFRRWVLWAVKVLWSCLGWSAHYRGNQQLPSQTEQGHIDYRTSPTVRCSWDEATCTQLVWLYNELSCKLAGNAAHHLFSLLGRTREDRSPRPSLRVGTIDIGGGTTDLSITTFLLESSESETARIRPCSEFRDGFNIAGDDILREVVVRHVLPAIGEAAKKAGVSDQNKLLADLFGRDISNMEQQQRTLRARFARQVAVPLALGLLSAYEQADLIAGGNAIDATFGDFFAPPVSSSTETSDPVSVPEAAASKSTLSIPRADHPTQSAIHYAEKKIAELTGAPFSLMDVPIRIDPLALNNTVRETLARPLSDLCEIIQRFDCDILLLTGRPSRWEGIISTVFGKIPVPPDRIVPMSRFRVGGWYPFTNALGQITDPKTTVVTGAILCALAEGYLEGFSFNTSGLELKSTARFIGELATSGQLLAPKVWFEVDVDSRKAQELTQKVTFTGPLAVGFRQLNAERWPTTRLFMLDFTSEDARKRFSGNGPYKLTLTLNIPEPDQSTERDEGGLTITEVEDANGIPVSPIPVEARLQTMPLGEGYWLDTGSVFQTD